MSNEKHYFAMYTSAFIFTFILERAIVNCFFPFQTLRLTTRRLIIILVVFFSLNLFSGKDASAKLPVVFF